jgi:hypothetical protein
MVLRLVIDAKDSGERYLGKQERNAKAVGESMKAAGLQTAMVIENRGRADIAQAGNFGPAWTSGFKSKPRALPREGVEVKTTMSGRGWRTFQFGRTLYGHPLLWIPFSGGDAVGVPVKRYPAPLVQVTSGKGLPLLISRADNKPKYFGKSSVNIPKKFHLIEIATAEGGKLGQRYAQIFMRVIEHG